MEKSSELYLVWAPRHWSSEEQPQYTRLWEFDTADEAKAYAEQLRSDGCDCAAGTFIVFP